MIPPPPRPTLNDTLFPFPTLFRSDNPEAPTFENTHVPMMLAGDTMDRIFAMWGVQTSNKSSDRVEDIDAEWSPKLTTFYTELFLDPKLFADRKSTRLNYSH